MHPRKIPIGPGLVFGLALVTGAWFLREGVLSGQDTALRPGLLDEVVQHVVERYVDPVDRDSLYFDAIEGVLDGLGDPNTTLLTRSAYENFRIQTEGDYGGVGLEIVERGDYITVVGPIPGGPSARAGIRPGDMIVSVDGATTRGWAVQQAVQVLRGQPGSAVNVQIERVGVDEIIPFDIVREQIQLFAVPFATFLAPGIGYVPLNTFSDNAMEEVGAAADSLRMAGATSLVLDLRGNPGGILDQGVGVADLFLDRGLDVVETRGRDDRPTGTLRASDPDHFPGMPIVVLVDRGSASASEIVAGALQDHDRALLIGSTTFGKGSVQSLFELSAGNVLKLTTARWYTPQGRSIERLPRVGMPDAGEPADAAALEEELENAPLTVQGLPVLQPDTVGRPTVSSVGGRTLFGGGGIVPDLLVAADTLATVEQEAVRAIFAEGGRFFNGLFDYAVRFLNSPGNRSPGFQVTDAELGRLHDFLMAEWAVQVDRETFLRASRFVRVELEAEIARQGWGQLEAFRRSIPFDPALQRAMELLMTASSPSDLFARASAVGAQARSGAAGAAIR